MSSITAKQSLLFFLSLMIFLTVTQCWADCALPNSPAVNICSPLNDSTVSSQFTISAAGTNSVTTDGIDVWMDGQKIGYYHGTGAIEITQFAAVGPHHLDVFAVGVNGELQHATSTFIVGSGCAVPASPAVNICSPLTGSVLTAPFIISATGKNSVTTAGMDIWLDGQKIGWYGGTNNVNISSWPAPGTHQLDIFAVGSNGELQHASSIFTVGGGCAVPTGPGVNICSPSNGSSLPVTSSVTISATGKNSVTTAGMDIWLDGQKIGWYGGTNSVTITTWPYVGTHQLDIFAVGSNGELQHAASVFSVRDVTLTAFHLSGIITGDDGLPIAGAALYFDYRGGYACGPGFCHATASTDSSGAYSVDFTATRGAMHGPMGTENAFTVAYVSGATGYDDDSRYILAPDQPDNSAQSITQSIMLRRRTRITAGDSTLVTISPDDAFCYNNIQDTHPWPTENVCRTVHINVPVAGTLTVEAAPNQSALIPALYSIWQTDMWHDTIANPISFLVPAGADVRVQVEMPWATPTSSFLLKTPLAPQ